MRKHALLLGLILAGGVTQAQTLNDAIQKTDNEQYDLSVKDLKKITASDPSNAAAYFYLGRNFYRMEEEDSAVFYWNKSTGTDTKNPFVALDKAAVLWATKKYPEARTEFLNVITSTKNKNTEVLKRVAEFYISSDDAQDYDAAINYLEAAIKLDQRDEEACLLMGDAQLKKTPKNGTNAIKYYNKALEINPKSPRGIVRVGSLYGKVGNYDLAEEKFREAIALDANYAPSYREMADVQLKENKFKDATESWKKYLALNNSDEARYRYIVSLFRGSQYCEALKELEAAGDKAPQSYYTYRMKLYSTANCEGLDNAAYAKGIEAGNKFFEITPKDKLIYQDFLNQAALYTKTGNDSLAIAEKEKAIAFSDEGVKNFAGELASSYLKKKKYDDAIRLFELKKKVTSLTPMEYLEMGRAYYFGPKDYAKADSSFAKLIELSPSYATGYLWKARSSYELDPESSNWLPKPFYQKVIELIPEGDRTSDYNKKLVIEAAKYLGDFYVNSPEKDAAKAKEYWKLVQSLDPEDAQAKAYLSSH